MGRRIRSSIITSVLALSVLMVVGANAQAQSDDGWKPCPRCQNNEDRQEAWERNNIDDRDVDPRDLSGVWGYSGVSGAFADPPPLTEYGTERFEQTLGELNEAGRLRYAQGSEQDSSLLNCDPLGYPRQYTYNYGFEFVMLPDRVVQFFEWGHGWRTIWTDGRTLPENPPVPRWLGYAVGRWEGDAFVVESSGYDDRSWIGPSPVIDGRPGGGWPHSEDMRVVERYTRVDYGTLEAELTIYDERVYTEPWVTPMATITLVPDTELWEYYCVPSESDAFNQRFGNN